MTVEQTMPEPLNPEPLTKEQAAATQQDNNQAAPKRNNTTLWVMIFLFALPNLAAFYFYFNRDSFDFSGLTTNYGTIISPVRQLDDMALNTLDNNIVKMSSLRGKWLMVSVGSSACEQNCQQNLYKMRQIRKATGEFFKRIDRVFFLTDTGNMASFRQLLTEYQGMDVILPTADNTHENSDYQKLLATFSVNGEPVEDGLYFIDPLGNYMMAYPAQAEAKKVLKDLMRLLKISQIG